MKRTVIQIVPRRSRTPEGVGDYARLIAERLLADHDLRTVFVSCLPQAVDQRPTDDWETHEVTTRSSAALLDALDRAGASDAPVMLHLSVYGYQDRGLPFWLAQAMEARHRRMPAARLLTIFHERSVTGLWWQRNHWLGRVQDGIVRRIQRVSDAAITTTQVSADALGRWQGDAGCQTYVLPVFSTIGETAAPAPVAERPARLAIFGRPGIFDSVYRDSLAQVEALVARYRITEIVDIGARPQAPPATIAGVPVRSVGEVSPAMLQAELATAPFGLIRYHADYLAKSTVFAAYCAQGAIPVCLDPHVGRNDGLAPGDNYLRFGDNPAAWPAADPAPLQMLQDGALRWYQPHSLAKSVDMIDCLLQLDRVPGAVSTCY